MAKFSIRITAENAVQIFEKGKDAPVILQPTWPNGVAFASEAEANSWGKIALDRLNGVEGDEIPGSSPSKPIRLISELNVPVEEVEEVEIIEFTSEEAEQEVVEG
jgi:hypothetical protein